MIDARHCEAMMSDEHRLGRPGARSINSTFTSTMISAGRVRAVHSYFHKRRLIPSHHVVLPRAVGVVAPLKLLLLGLLLGLELRQPLEPQLFQLLSVLFAHARCGGRETLLEAAELLLCGERLCDLAQLCAICCRGACSHCVFCPEFPSRALQSRERANPAPP